ncbi:MAG: TVP38/TMEM64 family protein [Gammaproteobacteria bacterium]|nr:TVP38/TMEM64 family protein [Gammaproteobacteria bacterium]
MTPTRIIIAIVIALLLVAFLVTGLPKYISLEYLKEQKNALQSLYQANPIKVSLVYVASYVVMAMLSLPVAFVMTLTAGVIFGVLWGTTLAVVASTLGATLGFLVARLLLHDFVQGKFGENLTIVNEGIRRDGAFYLFTMRVIPIFPFFVINAVMGLTPMRTMVFLFTTLVGMVPITLIITNAGMELGRIESASDIFSPRLIFSFVLFGLFPLIAKKILDYIKLRRC